MGRSERALVGAPQLLGHTLRGRGVAGQGGFGAQKEHLGPQRQTEAGDLVAALALLEGLKGRPVLPARQADDVLAALVGEQLDRPQPFLKAHLAEEEVVGEVHELHPLLGLAGEQRQNYKGGSLLGLDRKLASLVEQTSEKQEARLPIRDPYIFEFLGLKSKEVMGESDIEDALLDKLQEFLLELGYGFCFEARQKRIPIGSKQCFVDMVLYHRILKCHVLIELKVDEFNHEHLGQLNTYVNWYKKNVMTERDNPPVGILLCTQKDHALVEYALAGMNNKLFVSKYQLELPKKEEMEKFIEEQMKEVQG